MIIRIIFIILTILIAIGIAYWMHQDYLVRKDIEWIKVEAEILETKLDQKITTNTNTTKYYDSRDRDRPVNVYVERLSAYSSTSTSKVEYMVLAKYKYTYPDGQEHQNWAPVTGFMSRLSAENKMLDYPQGRKMMVYVQKNDPGASQIEKPDKSYPVLYMALLALVTVLICLVIFFAEAVPPEEQGRYRSYGRRNDGVNVYVR